MMMMALLVAAVIWGGCTAVVIGAVFLGRMLPAVGALLFDAPSAARPRSRDPKR